jgi:sulfur carrier protein ThiS
MKIMLNYSAILKLDNVKNGSSIDIDEETSVKDLLTRWKIKEDHQRYIVAYANDRKVGLSYILRDNDFLQLFLPIGGG